jgi:hypothetical protein
VKRSTAQAIFVEIQRCRTVVLSAQAESGRLYDKLLLLLLLLLPMVQQAYRLFCSLEIADVACTRRGSMPIQS